MANFRQSFMPYCLACRKDNSKYEILNRNYEKITFESTEETSYLLDIPEDFLKEILMYDKDVRANNEDSDKYRHKIFLYNDGCLPFLGNTKNNGRYFELIELLLGLFVS